MIPFEGVFLKAGDVIWDVSLGEGRKMINVEVWGFWILQLA